jgi:hypothetical protein
VEKLQAGSQTKQHRRSTMTFKRGSRTRVLVVTIAGILAAALACSQIVTAQQSSGPANSAPSGPHPLGPTAAGLRVRQVNKALSETGQIAASDKSYHGSVGPYVPLNVLWRIQTGGGDRTISVGAQERDSYPLDGAIFYVPANNHPALGTVPLYRLYNGADHMVSLDPNEGADQGYRVEGILGYPFVARQPGTSELIRTYNPSTGHHSLRNSTGLETEQGYIDQRLGVFGYPRYYDRGEQLLSLSGGGVTVDSNLVAGGAIWRWTWNGVQFINNWDNGRQIQTDIFPPDFANPTEAGDTWSTYTSPAAVNHGSPIALAENVGPTQRTRSITLEYDPDGTQQCYFVTPVGPCPGFGGGPNNPVVWSDVMLGKDVTLDFQGLGPVALYSTLMQVPKPLPAGTGREIPVIYARTSFYRMFTYDAETAKLEENPCANGAIVITPNYGGVIATNREKDAAIGIYAVNRTQGGSVDYLSLNFTWSCPGPPMDTGEFGSDTMIVDSVRTSGYAAGSTITNVYVISGKLQTVVEKMASLYQMRASVPR